MNKSLVAFAVLFPTLLPAAAVASPTVESTEATRVIDASLAHLRAGYVFPEKVPIIEKKLRASLSARRYSSISPQVFADRVTEDLRAAVHDKHLGLTYSESPLPLPHTADDAANQAAMQTRMARRNFGFASAAVAPGNIGVLKITGFAPPAVAGSTLAAAMNFLRNTDGLVLDLTGNGGGNGEMVALLLSYFVPPRTHLNDFFDRKTQSTNQMWSNSYVSGGPYDSHKPIAVAVDADTISAGEEVAYDLKTLKRATIVGEQTAGGANPGQDERIDDHFELFVPSGRAINPLTHTNWEGTGVSPDVRVKSAVAVEQAVQFIRDGLTRS
jgi:retinol-binding protein 3